MDEKESLDRNETSARQANIGMGATTRAVREPTLLESLEVNRNHLIKQLSKIESLIQELKENPHHEEIVKKYRRHYF